MVLSVKYVQDILVDVWRQIKIKIHQKWVSGTCGYTSYSLNIHAFVFFVNHVPVFLWVLLHVPCLDEMSIFPTSLAGKGGHVIVSRPISHKWESLQWGWVVGALGLFWLFLAKETDFAVMLLLFSFSYFHALNIDSMSGGMAATFWSWGREKEKNSWSLVALLNN